MKHFFFYILITLTSFAFAQESVQWETDFETAKEIAKSENKPLLMYLTGSDWCSPCKRLKKDFFSSEEFINKSSNVVLLMIDLPFREDIVTPEQKVKNQKISDKFNPKKSFPLLIGFNSKGREVSRLASYSGSDPSYHFAFLDSLLKQ